MTRRLVLVDLPYLRQKDPRATLGHTSLRARLGRDRVIELEAMSQPANEAFCEDGFADRVVAALRRPDAVLGIGCYVWNEKIVQRLLSGIRSRGFRGTVVLGGPQITYAPTGVDRLYPDADVFIRGYAEDALAEFVAGRRAPGVSVRGRDDASCRASFDPVALESPILAGLLPLGGFQRWETQRGCRFRCSFCQWPGGIGRPARFSPERIDAESAAFARSSTQEIAIQDPIFNSNMESWTDPLAALDRYGYRGRVSMQLRPELFGRLDRFLGLALAGRCKLEFGLQTIQREEMRHIERPNHIDKCSEVLSALRRSGMFVEISLIYGLPGQTWDSFRRNVDFARAHAVAVRAFPLLLLRGTRLHDRKHELGLVEDDADIPRVVAAPTFDHDAYQQMEELAAALCAEADGQAARWRAA